MKKGNIIAIILLILSIYGVGVFLIFPVISFFTSLVLTSSNPSVGIIGGADGPTAMFVSSSFYGYVVSFAAAIICIISAVGSIVYLVKNNSKK